MSSKLPKSTLESDLASDGLSPSFSNSATSSSSRPPCSEPSNHGVNKASTSSLLHAFRQYPTAVFWSVFFSLGVIMLAFDPQLLGNLYATPSFQREFGYLYGGSYIIPAPWQTALSLGNPLGQCLGALFAAYPMDLFGRKPTFVACVLGTTGIVFVQFFARSLGVLLAGELLGGLILGMYVVIAPAYASEVCPVELRGILTSYVNLCFVVGQLLANGVTAGMSRLGDHWAYSGAFAVQWFWCILILSGVWWAPESPWWYVRKGQVQEAERSLSRLCEKTMDTTSLLEQIIQTDKLEAEISAGVRYRDVFRKVNLRRTEVAVGVYLTQVLSGIYLIGYGTYFFQLAGLNTRQAFDMGIGFLALGVLGTICSWLLLEKIGRRRIYVVGLAFLALIHLIIGILDCVSDDARNSGVVWTQSCLMLVWNFVYNLTIGPVCFVILCEVSATRVKAKTIAVSTAVQAVAGIVMTVAIPYLINPDQADLRGKLGFLFGGLASLCLVWAYLRVPETGRRDYQELDLMFSRGVPARQFERYVIRDHRDDGLGYINSS